MSNATTSTTVPQPDLYSCTRAALAVQLCGQGHKTCHARTLFTFLYRDAATPLPLSISTYVKQHWRAQLPTLAKVTRSAHDGTAKLLLRLADSAWVETVIICEKQRLTLCVSTQVGCAQRCSFCQTGRMGLQRNLSAGEIVAQFLLARRWLAQNLNSLQAFTVARAISNIVFMGMGEPLDNLTALSDSIAIFTDPFGLALAQRRLAVSTVGNPLALRHLLTTYPALPIALSVHAAEPSLRSRLVPANRKWPLHETLQVLRHYPRAKLLIQYTLLAGINDSTQAALQLAQLLHDIPAKINLIVYNPIKDSSFAPSTLAMVKNFQDTLFQQGQRAMIRFSKGNDINAACGQLWTSESLTTAAPSRRN